MVIFSLDLVNSILAKHAKHCIALISMDLLLQILVVLSLSDAHRGSKTFLKTFGVAHL